MNKLDQIIDRFHLVSRENHFKECLFVSFEIKIYDLELFFLYNSFELYLGCRDQIKIDLENDLEIRIQMNNAFESILNHF